MLEVAVGYEKLAEYIPRILIRRRSRRKSIVRSRAQRPALAYCRPEVRVAGSAPATGGSEKRAEIARCLQLCPSPSGAFFVSQPVENLRQSNGGQSDIGQNGADDLAGFWLVRP